MVFEIVCSGNVSFVHFYKIAVGDRTHHLSVVENTLFEGN